MSPLLVMLMPFAPACGGIRRVEGYVDELASASASSSETTTDTSSGTTLAADTTTSTANAASDTSHTTADTTTTAPDTHASTTALHDTTASTTADADTSTTAEPTPQCGNAILEPLGSPPEECDDGNLDPLDGCDDTCAIEVRVFVTSTLHSGGQLQNLYLADAICGNLADDHGWPDAGKYRAWLSDSTTDARDRFKPGRGPLLLVNGLVLADSWPALLAGDLKNPLEVAETSETYHGPVWTGTRPDGTAVPGAEHCDDWASNSIVKSGHYGYSDRTTPEWTLSALDDNPIICPVQNALYCMRS